VENTCGGRGGALAFFRGHLIAQRGVEISRLERQPACYLQGNIAERGEALIHNLVVRIHSIIEVILWTGLAPWEFEFPFPGSFFATLQPTWGCPVRDGTLLYTVPP